MYEFIRVYLLAEIVPLPKYFFSICLFDLFSILIVIILLMLSVYITFDYVYHYSYELSSDLASEYVPTSMIFIL